MKMKNKDLLLGIDVGTTGAKCSVYEFSGKRVATSYREYPMIHPRPNWTEQDPHRWWDAVCENLQDIFKNQKLDSERIAVIGISTTNAIVFVDKDGEAVYNAISLHDQRSGQQVEWLKENIGEKRIRESACNRIANGSFSLPNIRWFVENKPELLKKSYKLLVPCGYLIHKLTGEFSMNRSRMSLTLLSDIRRGEWDLEIAEKIGLPENLLPEAFDSTEIVGEVNVRAAELTGLCVGTPVTAGAIDTVAATIGAGAVQNGDFALTIGSSGRICCVSDAPYQDSRLLNIAGAFPEQYIIVQSTNNACVSLRWFRDVFGKAVEEEARAAGQKLYAYLDTAAEKAKAGCGGMIWLPYLSGEQSPVWDPKARGVFFGIGLESDYGTFVRAILEGVAYSQRDCMDILLGNRRPEVIPIGGGAANSPLWCQIFADVLDTPIHQLTFNETETLGDVIIAAQALGIGQIPVDFGKTLMQDGQLFLPNPQRASIYNERFLEYRELYQTLKPVYAKHV